MPILDKLRGRPERPHLHARTVGNATVIHLHEQITPQAQALALGVAADPHHDLVVVDLPPGSPITLWESIAQSLPKGRRGVRLVIGGRSRETTALAGQWLAERIGRPVLAPDGAVLRGAGGALFVHSGCGSGWVRFRPGGPPHWEAKRFPRPRWDCGVFAEDWPTSARGVAEPVPGGLWVRPVGQEVALGAHRRRLVERMPCREDSVTVVIGCPGAPQLSLDDAARLWMRLPEAAREHVRFVQYGPVAVPDQVPFGQALADLLTAPITCYAGLPVAMWGSADVVTVGDDGSLGWPPFARELGYSPGADGAALLSHRPPVSTVHEVEPAVYWYAPDAVIEVVQSGLWVRPPHDGPNADAVRAARPDRTVNNVVYEYGPRMQELARDVLARLDPLTRAASRLVAAAALAGGTARVSGRALAEIEPAAPVEPERGTESIELASPGPLLMEPRRLESALSIVDTLAGSDAPPASVEPVAAQTMSIRLESSGLSESGSPDPLPAESLPAEPRPAEPDVDKPSPAPRPAEPETAGKPHAVTVRPQPTPAPQASALLPTRGLDEERGWLRKTLGQEYGVHANAINRILSEHPGFHGALMRSTADVITDAVAVRLYLTAHGEAIDQALRAATVGPHVPFARCVVSGLGRLPSHRGATVFAASPTSEQLRVYRQRSLVTEWGFVHALTDPCARQLGNTDVLVWSMTARRTRLLESDDTADRVLFVPGTSFKVLRMTEPTATARGRVLLRELAANEIGADGRVETGRVSLDELAISSLDGQIERWAAAEPPQRVAAAGQSRFGALPGLVSGGVE